VQSIRAALFCASFALGCGYAWVGSSGADGGLGRVAVQTPKNASAQLGLEFVVADALRREVLGRGAELVEDADRADWVVSGKILPVKIVASSLSPAVLTLEYELTLALDLSARSPGGREINAEARELSETERFFASSDAEAQRKNRGEALRRVSRVLAARFLDRIAEEPARENPVKEPGAGM
jgi:hypothetical protein